MVARTATRMVVAVDMAIHTVAIVMVTHTIMATVTGTVTIMVIHMVIRMATHMASMGYVNLI